MADKVVQLDPNDILAVDNSCRFGLKTYRLERLKAEIVAANGVTTPIEVSPLPKNHESGKGYQLTTGFYRHAAVTQLNDSGAGLTLPAVVHNLASSLERVKRQISENNERENLSPIDKAMAIARLMGEGATKMEIRNTFATPGGRKGLSMQPASNSFVNMTLSFLDLPKDIQTRIHDGRIGVAAAYQLTKVAPDKRTAVIEKIEADRLADIDKEEKEEEKFLAAEKKAAEAGEKVQAVVTEFQTVEKEAQSAADALAEAQKAEAAAVDAAAAAYKASKVKGLSKEDQEAANKAYKDAMTAASEAEKVTKAAEKEAASAKKEADKLKEKVTAAEAKQQENAAKIAAARSGGKGNGTTAPVSPREVQRAAAATPGAQTASQYVPLNATEMRKTVADLALPGGAEKVQAIGIALKDCFEGKTTAGQLFKALKKITGEDAPAKRGK